MGLKERREREKQERKRQIREAARELLLSEGLQNTSINKIAARAELGVGTIYFYFKSKEEIFAALQQEGLQLLYARIKVITETEQDPGVALKAVARIYLNFSRENKDYFDIINYFLSSPRVIFAPSLKNQVDEHGNRIIMLIVGIIEKGIKSGIFKEVDAWRFVMMYWATLHGLIQFMKLRATMLKGENYQELVEYSVDYLVESLIRTN